MEEKVDYLNNDQTIPGQSYVCLSFLSPESCLKNKELFSFYSFLKATKGSCDMDFKTYTEQYQNYKDQYEDKLNEDFTKQFGMSTNIRGLKVRGVYSTLGEAQFRAKALQRLDPNFNVYVGQVGFWLPWDPAPSNIENQEYANEQLNELMKNYNENQKQKDIFYEQQKTERIAKNTHENQQKKVFAELEKSDTWLEQKESQQQFK